MNEKCIKEGTRLKSNIFSQKGILLLKEGTVLKRNQIAMLEKYDWHFEGEDTPTNLRASISDPLVVISETHIQEAYNETVRNIRTFFTNVFLGRTTDIVKMFNQFSIVLEEVLKEEEQAVSLVYEVKNYDETTYRHSMNVGLIAGLVGKILNLSAEEILLLGKMGILHDIGKVKIHNEILHKPDRLNDEEYEEVKLHTSYGYDILSDIPRLDRMVSKGALTHHERLDGSGYPGGLIEKEIPYLVQILSIADIYDAICTERSYQKGRSSFIAIEQLIKDAQADKVNKTVVKEFVRYLMKQYIGRKVVLNTGEEGVITFIPYEEPHRPLLKIGTDFLDLKKVTTLSITDFATT